MHPKEDFAIQDLHSSAATRHCFRTHRLWLCVHKSLSFKWVQRCFRDIPEARTDRMTLRCCDRCRSIVSHKVGTTHVERQNIHTLTTRLLLMKVTCSNEQWHGPDDLVRKDDLAQLLGYIYLPICAHYRPTAPVLVDRLCTPPPQFLVRIPAAWLSDLTESFCCSLNCHRSGAPSVLVAQ